jgi:UDP-glucuronate 4-epimerase
MRVATMPITSGSVFNVSGGSSVSVLQVLDVLREYLGDLRVLHGPELPGDVPRTGGSNQRLRDELGWVPSVTLREGLARQVEWMRAGGSAR